VRILSPPRRTNITGATFSRASEAYDSLGRIALPELPRLEYIAGVGWVTWVEEGSSNLLPVGKQKFVGWSTYSGAIVTLTQNQVVPEWGAKDATRIQTSGGTTLYKYIYTVLSPSVSGQAYSEQVCIKNIGTTTVRVQSNLGSIINISAGEIKKVTFSDTGNGVSDLQLHFRAVNVDDSLDFIAWHPMIETKAYNTSFTDTSRAAESLTMPTTGLSVSEGTIEGIVEITDVVKRQTESMTAMLFQLRKMTGSNGIAMYLGHMMGTALWRLCSVDDSDIVTANNFSDALTANGFYYYKAYWNSIVLKAEFWNLTSKTKILESSISSPSLPSAFSQQLYIGNQTASICYANTRFGRHRLSNIARTDDPDFNNLMPNDANTVGIFDPTPIYNHVR
jgi:hypothetical protein